MMIQKEIVIESLAVTDMTTAASAVLFRSESKGTGCHANERSRQNLKFHLPGYDIYRNDRLVGTKGGIAILVKKTLL